jgi:hypothetical protein
LSIYSSWHGEFFFCFFPVCVYSTCVRHLFFSSPVLEKEPSQLSRQLISSWGVFHLIEAPRQIRKNRFICQGGFCR